jgi:hypothetical protein
MYPAFDATNLRYTSYLFSAESITEAIASGFSTDAIKILKSKALRLCVNACPKKNETVCKYGNTPSADTVTLAQQIANGTCVMNIFNTRSCASFLSYPY